VKAVESSSAPSIPVPRDRRVLQYGATLAFELKKREHWRRHPADWCRERVKIEPSWKVLSAAALGITVAALEKKWPQIEDKQIQILESVRDNIKTHVRSGHQIGKTMTAACVILWFLDCFRPSRAITTSATWTDVEMKLWGAIRDLYIKNGSWLGKDIGRATLKLRDRWYALGLSPDRVEPFQGHNDKYVLVVFDEGSSIDQKFSDAADAEATRLLEIGNPLIARGPFFKHAKSSEYNHIHVSCLDHPNYILQKEVIPGGPRFEWVESRKTHWGETSPLYLSRVAGEFPEESSGTLFPLATINDCFARYKDVRNLPRDSEGKHQLGLDVARAGGDHTVGYDRDSVKVDTQLLLRAKKVIDLAKTEHHGTRMMVQSMSDQDKYDTINVDAGGEGSGISDELWSAGYPVVRVMFGANPISPDYFNCRAEMYWMLSKAMKAGLAIEPDPTGELEEELSVIGGMASLKEKSVNKIMRAVFWLPPKEEIASILGRSPDKADALCLATYHAPAFYRAPGDLGIS